MSTLNMSSHKRVWVTLAVFVLIVLFFVFLYGEVGLSIGGQSPYKWALSVFGPVLALFTHLSFILFLPLAAPVVALICVAVVYPSVRMFAIIGVVGVWLSIGWFLHDLF